MILGHFRVYFYRTLIKRQMILWCINSFAFRAPSVLALDDNKTGRIKDNFWKLIDGSIMQAKHLPPEWLGVG